MSLKAKIEAVIYAAEEPVTLSQLAAVFAADLPPTPDPSAEDQPSAESIAEPSHLNSMGDWTANDFAPAAAFQTIEEETVEKVEQPKPDPAAAEAEAKRAARARERGLHDRLKGLVGELIQEYAAGDRGMEIREVAGGYRIATKPEYHDVVRSFAKSLKPPMKLSLQALETLAVIAYKQPVTAPEVSEIRGVDSSGVLGGLMTRKLIATAGRKQVIGRPILYKTTREFLLRFGLKDLNELPSIEEFEKLAGDVEIELDNSLPEERAFPFEPEEASDPEPVEPETSPTIEPPQSAAAELGTGSLDPLDGSAPLPPIPPQSGETAAAGEPTVIISTESLRSDLPSLPAVASPERAGFPDSPVEGSESEPRSEAETHHG